MKDEYPSRLSPPAVERMAAASCLGALPGGLERPRDCAGAGRDPGRGESVAQAGARRRRPSLGPSHAPELGAAPVCRATAQLPTLLAYGAEAYGFVGDVWTSKRVAAVIKQEFGVVYHRAHVSRLLRQIGWSVQKPIQRALQRDEQAIARLTSERWPVLPAKPNASGGRSSG